MEFLCRSHLRVTSSHSLKPVGRFFSLYYSSCGVGLIVKVCLYIGLRPNENITVQLAARTMSGEGPLSDEVVVSNKAAGKAMHYS